MKKIYYTLLVITFTGCQLTTSSSNLENDKANAEMVADKLYEHIAKGNYAAADTLFAKEFFSVTPKDSLHLIFSRTKEMLGDYKMRNLKDWSTQNVSGAANRTDYLLTYDIEYTRYKAVETLGMAKTTDTGSPKILRYNVASEGFLKWNK